MKPDGRPVGKVLIVLNKAWNLYNFRAGLIRALCAAGYEVVAAAPRDEYADRLAELGCRFVDLPQDNHGTSLWADLLLTFRFWRLLRAERPDVYLGYTVKPNTYGSWVASQMGIATINNIAGLGTAFIRGGMLAHLVRFLYKLGLKRSHKVFFQNTQDRDLFLQAGLVRSAQVGLLPGSGVDLQRFAPPEPQSAPLASSDGLRFLLMARLLVDKGVNEFVAAAKLVLPQHPQTRFQLLGFVDEDNPRGIKMAQIDEWVKAGLVEYLGVTDDVRPYIAASDCVVLPSYREGTSRALLEAAAMGKPLIASNVPGCKEVIDDGVNGFLCEVRSAADLAQKMLQFLALSDAECLKMGQASRHKAQVEYDESLVFSKYLTELSALCPRTVERAG